MSKANPQFHKDFYEFIALCNQYELEYLVIGGFAVSIHGYPRATKDLDICINRTLSNIEKFLKILDDFGFGSLNLTVDDFIKEGMITQLGYEPVRIDILNDLNGLDFEIAYKNRREVILEGVETNFIGYNELLIVKEKAGRKQDLLDVEKLKKRNRK